MERGGQGRVVQPRGPAEGRIAVWGSLVRPRAPGSPASPPHRAAHGACLPPGGQLHTSGGRGRISPAGQRGKLRLTQPARVVAWLGLRAILGRRGPEQGAGRRKSPHPREPGEVDREEGRQVLGPRRPTQRCMAWLRRQDLWRRRTEVRGRFGGLVVPWGAAGGETAGRAVLSGKRAFLSEGEGASETS